jgi:hypothetical protein
LVKVPKEIIAEAEALAEHLEKMDETFRWKWVYSYLPDVRKQECVLFVIYSPTKDQAYKRGTYFMSKLALSKFERIEKGYYWVEEYPSNLHHKEDNEITIHPEDAEFINKRRSPTVVNRLSFRELYLNLPILEKSYYWHQ